MSGGITYWPMADDPPQPRGAGRSLWLQSQPDEAVLRYRTTQGQSATVSQNPAGAGGSSGYLAGVGTYFARATAPSAWAHLAAGDSAGITPSISPNGPMDAVAPVAYPRENAVLVFREEIQWTQNADAVVPASIATAHGITCQFNTQYTGIPNGLLAAAAVSFVGIAWQVQSGQMLLVTKRNPAAAVTSVIPLGDYDPAQWALVEHRLYAPTTTDIGRYELWVNQRLIATRAGSLASFPIVQAAGWKYGAMLYLTDNYAGKVGGIRVRYSEVFTCDGSESALAY
ncbi:MAG: hypothetical protein KF822_12455 [Steroidobacteraceae bacterium]|nr:hypothetical protein [Steroidobacteraceae bacterium]